MVLAHQAELASQWATGLSAWAKNGCTPQVLHRWVAQAERDVGKRAGLSSTERERENRELKRANKILRKGAAFLARAKLDRLGQCGWRSSARTVMSMGPSRSASSCPSHHRRTARARRGRPIRLVFPPVPVATSNCDATPVGYGGRTSVSMAFARPGSSSNSSGSVSPSARSSD